MLGVVESFGADGWGMIEAPSDGGPAKRYRFHSTAITDGTRSIDVGRLVTFELMPGRQGRWEATQVRDAHTMDGPAPATLTDPDRPGSS